MKTPKARKTENLFNLKYTRNKFDVLIPGKGQQGKGTAAGVRAFKPLESKTKAAQVRERTLLKELRHEGKAGALADHRIGKGKATGNTDRFVKTKMLQAQKLGKGQRFNLNNEDDEVLLTHRGKELQDDEDFEEEVGTGSEEEGEAGGYRGRFENGSEHFGNFENNGEGGFSREKRSKAEIMREVIARSKQHKAERQKVRDANEDLCEDINKDFDGLRQEIVARHGIRDDNEARGHKDDGDDYDALVRRMTFDRRAAPTDRRKTPEEIAEELKQREAARLDRMKGEGEDGEKGISANEASLGRVGEEMSKMLQTYLHGDFESAYTSIARACRQSPQSTIALARECRRLISESLFGRQLPLILLLIGRVFSTSDAHHLVATPAMIYACRALSSSSIEHRWGLLVCSALLDFQKESRRWIPEIANFLAGCIGVKSSAFWTVVKPIEALNNSASTVADMLNGKGDLMSFAVALVERMTSMYSPASATFKTFILDESVIVRPSEPARIAPTDRLATLPELTHAFSSVVNSVVLPTMRDSMSLRNAAPIALPSLNPEVEDGYLPGRLRKRTRAEADPKEEHGRLLRAVRKETKGARREILKDSRFLAREQSRQSRDRDAAYKQRLQRTLGDIANDD